MDLAIGWFETCKTTHPDCAKASSAAPSRLLEIGDVDSDTPLRLRTSVFLSDVRYATLSHCWGKLKIVRLLQQNLDSFQQSIPLGDLPKTFQDAITIARQFKLQYIWIDSLCIIQDDKDDWRKEASLMANVYGGSTLNIAATGAVDGSDGLFFSRDKNLVRNTQVELDWTDTEDPLPNRFYHCVDGNLFDRHFTHSPLYKRAWCVQERILAPRTLHFGKTQIAWECQTTVRLETFPNMLPNEALGHFQVNDDFWFLARRRGMKMSWYSIVNSYSTCLLTMKSDKLIALSGVAQNLAAQIGGQYLYGHWTEYLPQSLLWMVTGRNYSRMDSNMAPSWSCKSKLYARAISDPSFPKYLQSLLTQYSPGASLDGPTWLSTSHDHVTFCSLEPSHEAEPTSQAHSLDAGRIITLKCKRLMQVFALKLLGKLTTSEGSAYTVSFQADRKPSIKLNFYFDEQQPGVSSQACYLLPVTHGVACEMCERGEGVNSEEGLVVEPVLGRKGCFRRLGVYETYGATTKVFAGVRAHAWKQSPGRDECETYASVVPKGEDGMQWFTIKLI